MWRLYWGSLTHYGEQMKYWVTSDSHFGHIRLAEMRGFTSVEDMNETLLENINSVVSRGDMLYHLGDFAMGSWRKIPSYRERIKCENIKLLFGNHDAEIVKRQELRSLFTWTRDTSYLKVDLSPVKQVRAWLSHYCHLVWPKSHYGYIHLAGHSHNNLKWLPPRAADIGLDTNELRPYNLEEVWDKLNAQPYEALDHHTEGSP